MQEPATVYCSADEANLCNKCDSKLHETKVASRHVRTPIGKVRRGQLFGIFLYFANLSLFSKGGDIFGQCRLHPNKVIEYVCSECHIPVCITCKMVGNHANGEASKHQLVSVTEAYHSVMQEAQTVRMEVGDSGDNIFTLRLYRLTLFCKEEGLRSTIKLRRLILEQRLLRRWLIKFRHK